MKAARSLCAGLACLVLTSCPALIRLEQILHAKDSVIPMVTITSPADGSWCAQTVVVEGAVQDASTDTGDVGSVRALRYEIPSASLEGEVVVGEDGAFTFQFATATLGSPFVLRVVAEDWNGNEGAATLTLLLLEGNDIPSFSVMPGNREVTLSWGEVPLAESYTLYYTANGSLPSPDYGSSMTGVSSPLTLLDLENGAMHVFRLQAHSSEGEDNWSDYARAIPLSEQTLAPRVLSEARQLRVTWSEIPGADEFEVWRSETRDGSYISVSGTVRANEYVDDQAVEQHGYYYKVRPALAGSLFSVANHGVAAPIPTDRITRSLVTHAAAGVAVSGDLAFVADDSAGLLVVDISVPELATIVDTVDTPGRMWSVAAQGGRAFGAGENVFGFRIFDAGTPAATTAAEYLELGNTFCVAVSGDYAYVGAYGINIIDVSLPGSAHLEKAYGGSNACDGLAVADGYAYVASGTTGLRVYDVDPPAATSQVGIRDTLDAGAVVVDADYAYVADAGDGLRIIALDPPGWTLPIVATVDTPGSAMGLALSGHYLYLADYISGLHVIDVSVPASASICATVSTPGPASGVATGGAYAYVADGGGAFHVVDPRTPASATSIQTLGITGGSGDVAVAGGLACSVSMTGGVVVLNVSSGGSVSVAKTIAVSDLVRGVDVWGNHAYVAADSGGLLVLDVSDPGSAGLVATAQTIGYAWGVEVAGAYAYVADLNSLAIIDITQPEHPVLVKTLNTATGSVGVTVRGGFAYVAGGADGLHIVDVNPPRDAFVVKTVATPHAYGVAVAGDYAYVATGTGVQIVDVSVPASASVVGSVGTGVVRDVAISGGYAYLANEVSGFTIADISAPLSAFVVKTLAAVPTMTVAAGGRYVYAGTGSSLQVFDLLPSEG